MAAAATAAMAVATAAPVAAVARHRAAFELATDARAATSARPSHFARSCPRPILLHARARARASATGRKRSACALSSKKAQISAHYAMQTSGGDGGGGDGGGGSATTASGGERHNLSVRARNEKIVVQTASVADRLMSGKRGGLVSARARGYERWLATTTIACQRAHLAKLENREPPMARNEPARTQVKRQKMAATAASNVIALAFQFL